VLRKSIYSLLFVSSISVNLFAQVNQLEQLSVGTDQTAKMAYVKSTDQKLIDLVNAEADLYCDGRNLCKFISKPTSKKGWTVSFTLGTGNAAGNGTNIYLGGQQQTNQQNSIGVTIRYDNQMCETSINIGHSEMQNSIARLHGERDGDLSQIKAMTSDTKFEKLLKLEYAKLLANSGCGN